MTTRTAVVTGASTGIGRATALYLDRDGFSVFAGVRREEDAASLRTEASERLTPIMLDVTDPATIEAAAQQISEAVGEEGLGGLVNNAGIAVARAIEFMDLDALRRQFEVNVIGVVACTKAFLPAIRRGQGRIVNIGSMGGYLASPFMSPYSASKFAIEAISDSLRRELRLTGLDVSLVEPGSIATPIWDKGKKSAAEIKASMSSREHELYGDGINKIEQYVVDTEKRGIAPDNVAKAVHHALTSARPKTRYRVGVDAKISRLLTHILPDRWIDAITARLIGLKKQV